MREIKFRGKSFDNGEWVYGDYHKRAGGVHCIIKMEPDENGKVVYVVHQAVPDTIGQFTGLHDKNGKEIYEGDIILERLKGKRKDGDPYEIIFEDCQWFGRNAHGNNTSLSLLNDFHDIKVIGNIHDNPELLNK